MILALAAAGVFYAVGNGVDALGSGRDLGLMLEGVARLGVALLFQVALEAEVTEFLGRDRYARGERAHEGSRNGYRRSP